MDRSECISFFERNIPDRQVRKLIFCGDEEDEDLFLSNRDDMLRYFSTMMNLAFTYVYGKYRIWRDNGGEVTDDNNMNFKRVISTLDELYNTYDLSFEVIEGVLLDIQLDDSMRNEIKNELHLNDIFLNKNFAKCAYKARKYRRSSRFSDEGSVKEQREELIDFFKSFPFLKYISIVMDKKDGVTRGENEDGSLIPYDGLCNVQLRYDNDFAPDNGAVLDTHGQIASIGKEFYFLDHIEVHDENDEFNDKTLFLYYTQIGDYNRTNLVIIENVDNNRNNEIITIRGEGVAESYYLDLFPGNMTLDQSDGILRDLHSINYKYVKNLSLAVSDVLSTNGKLALKKQYAPIHSDIFKCSGQTNDINAYNWDIIVGMLLIRENANNVLKTIFMADSECYQKILYNLEVRFGQERVNSNGVISNIQRKQTLSTYSMEDLFCKNDNGEQAYSSKSLEINFENKAEIAACVIIDVLSKVSNDDKTGNTDIIYDFPIEMKGRIEFLKDLYKSTLSLGAKKQTLESIIQHTLRGLICFYEGFFEYAEIKTDYEDESYYKCLTEERINKYQHDAESEFANRVQAVIKELADPKYSTIDGILKRVQELCSKCCNNKGEQTIYGKLLYEILGRNNIMDFSKLEVLGQCMQNIDSPDDFDEALDMTVNVFRYLSTGDSGSHIGSVYPYVGTYEYTNHGKDGFNVARFTIITEKRQIDVEVLSEFRYRIGERYFCLPNLTRSNDTLWVDPVLIKMVDFDMNIVRGENNE